MSEPVVIDEAAVAKSLQQALAAVEATTNLDELRQARQAHFGEGSPLARLNAEIRNVAKDQKAQAGKLLGAARGQVSKALDAKHEQLEALESATRLAEEAIDVTAVTPRRTAGARHPLSLLQERIAEIFVGMGWEVAEGPEVESEWFNFDALNTAPDHPARSEQDTFFLDPAGAHLVLRSQTSPVQIRALLERGVPLYVISPGKVFRKDELDATHTPVFHQVEGLAIDRGLTMAHLRGTLEHFARAMFGEEAKIRLRPNFFPFTEPSAEMDVWQPHAKGGARWVEWGGCGMVNQNVLRSAGVDPEQYQGFAFGMGIERTLQFRNDLNDMRDMVEGDIRFSKQFGMVI